LERSDNIGQFDKGEYGQASEMVPTWVAEMLAA
jgi:hypothetical protein